MNKITCIIVEDEQLAIDILTNYIDKIDNLTCLGTFFNASEASVFLLQNKVDIIFVDIELPDMKGTDFVKSLMGKEKVIFTTAYESYAIDAFNLNAIDYLTKPINFNRFVQAINKTHLFEQDSSSENTKNRNKLFVKVDNKIVNITLEDILYIKSLQKYVAIYTKSGEYVTMTSMYKLLESLPESMFFRIHKSFIVNIDHISSIEGNFVRIEKEIIPIAKGQKSVFLNQIKETRNILLLNE